MGIEAPWVGCTPEEYYGYRDEDYDEEYDEDEEDEDEEE